ncbi:MFS general substrate transporter [Mytilinidion resinicola]|uniref:MFS general substrate transporter n=1 Tax=Mytilinidion resinicola TaxID=574789 RepID=A0A6A6Y420_9PEZI|nr:MFS general substrate transporter [Mytilinidion resinicola]KAF2803268.1 MFS general substrate transporter [Mytilinidion resinicola]
MNVEPREQIAQVNSLATAPGVMLASFAHLDEKKILRKMDLRLISMLALLYLRSFLDRGNIGMPHRPPHITGPQFNWCLTAFFFPYCIFEVPSNLLLKRLRPSVWLPTIMVAWGLVMSLMGIVQNFHGLLVTRIFLGAAEAGLFPGVAYYITMWYCRHEAQTRQALFFSVASIAGAFSGLLAFGIAHMDGVGGLAGRRWMFILEGILTVLVALLAYFVLAFVVYRLKYQGQGGEERDGVQGRVSCNVWLYWGIVAPLYGISLFLPTIIKGLGYTSSTAQLLTVPIYITASVLAIAVGYASDRYGKRSPFILVCLCIMAVGFIMCIASSKPGVVYAGLFFAACALYPAFAGSVTWLSNNLAGSTKRAMGQAIQIGVGGLAGAMASNFYRSEDAPHYRLGHALELVFIVAGIFALLLIAFNYRRINAKREWQLAEGGHAGYSPEEMSALSDRAMTFKYTL